MRFVSFAAVLSLTVLACGGSPEADSGQASSPPPESGAATPPASSPPATAAASDDPCKLLAPADIAAALGVDISTVGAGEPGPYASADAPECVWEVANGNLEDTVTLWLRKRNEKTAPDGWSRAIQGLISNGEKIGSQTLEHEPADLGGASGGALSGVLSSFGSTSRIYSWQVGEEVYYRLTLARSFADSGGELPDPPPEVFEALVRAISE